jgi:integrase
MARITTPLSDKEVKAAKPKDKMYKLFDGGGLYLEVPVKQSKRWRIKYRFDGKEKTLSLGTYPHVSLKSARSKREEIKQLLAEGIDPSQIRKEKKEQEVQAQEEFENTFERSASLYIEHLRPDRNEKYWNSVESAFKRLINPMIGDKNINDVKAKDIIDVLNHIQSRGTIETAHRLFTQISSVFKYAVSHEYSERNPCNDMDKSHVLKKVQTQHYATITDNEQIGKLLYDINKYSGAYTARMALKFAPYVAIRPYNIRFARWKDIDFDSKLWRIPAEEMKTKQEHLIPLTDSSLEILLEVHNFTGDGEYIFPSDRNPHRPFSDTTLNKALTRMGYDSSKLVTHGFRAMFSTVANEQSNFRPEIIETQLAHKVGNEVSRAYNRAQYLQERKELIQWWSDYLDEQQKKYTLQQRKQDV